MHPCPRLINACQWYTCSPEARSGRDYQPSQWLLQSSPVHHRVSHGCMEGPLVRGGRGWLACHLSLCMCAALCSCKISARGGRWAAVSCRLEGSPGSRQEAGAGGANHFMSASPLLRFSTSFQLTGTADPPPTPDQTLTIFCLANLQAGRNGNFTEIQPQMWGSGI